MGFLEQSRDWRGVPYEWLLGGLLAILAGVAADLGGARRVSIVGAALLAAGVAALTFPASVGLYPPWGLIAAGEPLFRVGLILVVADLYARDDDRRDAGFTLLVMGVGLGGFVGRVALNPLPLYDAETGFAIAAAVPLVGALALATAGRAPVTAASPSPGWSAGRAAAILFALVAIVALLDAAAGQLQQVENSEDVVLLGLTISEPVWTWAVAVALLTPAPVLAWLWLRMGRHQPSGPAKIAIGAVLTAAGLLVGFAVAPPDPVTAGAFTVSAQLFVHAIALALVTRVAPRRRRGLFVGLWLAAPWFTSWIPGAARDALASAGGSVVAALAIGSALAAALAAHVLVVLGAGRGQQGSRPEASSAEMGESAAAGRRGQRLTVEQRVLGLCLDLGVLVALSMVVIAAGHGAGSFGMFVLAGDAHVRGIAGCFAGLVALAALVSRPRLHALLVFCVMGGLVTAWLFFVSVTEELGFTLATSSLFVAAVVGRALHLAVQLRPRRARRTSRDS